MRWIVLIAVLAPAHAEELIFLHVNERGAEEWLRIKDGATVVRIPRGEYQRRAYEGKIATQKPKPQFVESFYVDRTEVTNRQFALFLNETHDAKAVKHGIPGIRRGQMYWQVTPGLENHPVTAATGHGAVAYAKWMGGYVPSIPEWEKAAGGAQGNLWPWGDAKPDRTRANFGGEGGPMRVGSFAAAASPYGCLDMAGNVYERTMSDRGAVVIKGGAWVSTNALNLRVLDMCVQPMEVAERSVGFRCAMRDPQPERATRKKAKRATLKYAKSWKAAVAEATKRGVPIFLSLQFDTCGQCDRTRAQLFRDPRFVAYCNEKMVVAAGHRPGDAVDDPHLEHEDGSCSIYPGLKCHEHHAVFNQAIMAVGRFAVSPGNFVLSPDGKKVLIAERELPKWGWATEQYLAAFERALRSSK